MEEDTEIIEGLGTKGADRATEVLWYPATTVIRPCPLLPPGSEVYEGVPNRMARPKRAKLSLTTNKRYPLQLEGSEEDGSKENQRAAVHDEGIDFWPRLGKEIKAIIENDSLWTAKIEEQGRRQLGFRKEER